jgi:hypothetical protein
MGLKDFIREINVLSKIPEQQKINPIVSLETCFISIHLFFY